MTRLLFSLMILSILAAVGLVLLRVRREPRASLYLLGILLLFGLIPISLFDFPTSSGLASRGETENDLPFIFAMYFFLLLGMLAQFGYTRFSQPKRRRRKFDLGLFLAPLFTSPIIFIPLYAAVSAAEADPNTPGSARIMLLLVAFENGFLWKLIFDQRRTLASDTSGQ